jgi:hypothetical protein
LERCVIAAKPGLVAVSQHAHQKIVLQGTQVIGNQYSSQEEAFLVSVLVDYEAGQLAKGAAFEILIGQKLRLVEGKP